MYSVGELHAIVFNFHFWSFVIFFKRMNQNDVHLLKSSGDKHVRWAWFDPAADSNTVNPEVNPHSTISPYILPSLQFCILYLSITTRGLYIFNPLLIYVILCNKVLENGILIHDWYSIAVWNQERVMMAQVRCYECCSTRQESC